MQDARVIAPRAAHGWRAFIDGASRNNPGASGAGVHLTYGDAVVVSKGVFLGSRTNNQAEYLALLLALFFIKDYVPAGEFITIFSDSQLLTRQIAGLYRVRQPELIPLHRACRVVLSEIKHTLLHVMREHNTKADFLANEGIDHRVSPPNGFVSMLHELGVVW